MRIDTIQVKGCSDCPFRKERTGHGEGGSYCSLMPTYEGEINYDNKKWYSGYETPNWCPLIQSDIVISIIKPVINRPA